MQSFDVILTQVSGLRAELHASRQKTLFELFATSFAVIFWAGGTLATKVYGPYIVSLLVISPLVVNACMWITWVIFRSGLIGISSRPIDHQYFDDGPTSDEGYRMIYKEFDALRFILLRERMIERIIDYLTALQFFMMAIILAYALVRIF